VAGRKLSEWRDLLGMAGLVRYVHHHDGPLAGWVMWGLLWLHAASRTIAFGVIAHGGRSDEVRRMAKARRDHYRRVVRGYSKVRMLAGLRRPRGPQQLPGVAQVETLVEAGKPVLRNASVAPAAPQRGIGEAGHGPNTASSEYERSPTGGASAPLK
jgi:hypothetical protein